jgi:hypothetical protein
MPASQLASIKQNLLALSHRSVVASSRNALPIELALMLLVAILLGVVFAIHFGRDLNWDQLTYHYSISLNWNVERLSGEFMPYNPVSYINPLPHLLFYNLVSRDVSTVNILAITGAVHGLNLFLVYCVARIALTLTVPRGGDALLPAATVLCRAIDAGVSARAGSLVSMLLAAFSSIFFMLVGTSFADPLVSIPVLAGVAALLLTTKVSARNKYVALLYVAGAALGIGLGLKLSNLILAVSCVVCFVIWVSLRNRKLAFDEICRLSLASVLGFFLVSGYWSFQMLNEFGNPVFPLFNGIFKSADFDLYSARHARFTGGNITDLLLMPFQMITGAPGLICEVATPDLRFATFAVLCLFGFVQVMFGKISTRFPGAIPTLVSRVFSCAAERPLPAMSLLWTIFAGGYLLWLVFSANARYFASFIMLAGVPMVVCAYWLMGWKRGLVFSVLVLMTNSVHVFQLGTQRWGPASESERWYRFELPNALKEPKIMLITPDANRNGFVMPYLHPSTRLVALGSNYYPIPGRNGYVRAKNLIDLHRGELRSWTTTARSKQEGRLAPFNSLAHKEFIRPRLDIFGVEPVEGAKCELVSQPDPDVRLAYDALIYIVSCPLKRVRPREMKLDPKVEAAMERAEKKFPDRYPPGKAPTLEIHGTYTRSYINTECRLVTHEGYIVDTRCFGGPSKRIEKIE